MRLSFNVIAIKCARFCNCHTYPCDYSFYSSPLWLPWVLALVKATWGCLVLPGDSNGDSEEDKIQSSVHWRDLLTVVHEEGHGKTVTSKIANIWRGVAALRTFLSSYTLPALTPLSEAPLNLLPVCWWWSHKENPGTDFTHQKETLWRSLLLAEHHIRS